MSDPMSESEDGIDDDLKQALMAAFGDDALDMLEDDDGLEDESPVDESLFSGSIEPEGSESGGESILQHGSELDGVLKRLEEASENNSSPLVRYMSELNRAIYGGLADAGKLISSDGQPVQRFVMFLIDEQQYALPLEDVREIRSYPSEITALPFAPPWLRGIFNLRGEILSVTDFRTLIGCETERPRDGERIIIIRSRKHSADTGLAVDKVAGIRAVSLQQEELQALSSSCPLITAASEIESIPTAFVSTDGLFEQTGLTLSCE
ncbi:MAG: chemotaxis protein CheW [Planctomycetota bacterium]